MIAKALGHYVARSPRKRHARPNGIWLVKDRPVRRPL